jgi:protein TonB
VAPPVVAPTAPALDPKAVEAEVQRQLAAKRKELEKTAASKKTPGTAAEAPLASAASVLAEPTLVPAVPTIAPTARPEPTAVPTEPPAVEAPKPAAVPFKEIEVQRGDLVGPGAGVVEPALIGTPRVVYPPLARQQRVGGKVVVLVLVDEDGKPSEVRLQQGLPGQGAINEAVVAAMRNAKFRSATKNGIAVKMWRPVIVEVKP